MLQRKVQISVPGSTEFLLLAVEQITVGVSNTCDLGCCGCREKKSVTVQNGAETGWNYSSIHGRLHSP